MIGKLICWWTGKHKRGKRILGWTEWAAQTSGLPVPKVSSFQCPRCKATWTRKKAG